MSTAPDLSHNPVNNVIWAPIGKVYANDYNPNAVALMELQLLYVSIDHDGYTQPIVTIHDPQRNNGEAFEGFAAGVPPRPIRLAGGFVIVDGFHRYGISKRYRAIAERNHGLLPIVVIDKPLNDRIASTVRHNRARGKHSIDGMGALVTQLLHNGWDDARICLELGLEKEELIRLKHVTGYAKFFLGAEYSRAAETSKQIETRLDHERQTRGAV